MSRSVRDPQSWRGVNTEPAACLSKEKAMSLTADRRTHFRRLLESPRHNHGTNLNPVPVPTGTLRELLDDAETVDQLREAIDAIRSLAVRRGQHHGDDPASISPAELHALLDGQPLNTLESGRHE